MAANGDADSFDRLLTKGIAVRVGHVPSMILLRIRSANWSRRGSGAERSSDMSMMLPAVASMS